MIDAEVLNDRIYFRSGRDATDLRTYHRRGEQRKHFHAVQMSATRSDEVLPGFGGEFGFPGFKVGAWPVCFEGLGQLG